jgi:hypothetical protein
MNSRRRPFSIASVLLLISFVACASTRAREPLPGPEWSPAARAARRKMEQRLNGLIQRGVVVGVSIEKPGENGADYDITVSVMNARDIELVKKATGKTIAGFPVIVEPVEDATQGLILSQ